MPSRCCRQHQRLNWVKLARSRAKSYFLEDPGYVEIHDAFSTVRVKFYIVKIVYLNFCGL